MQPELIMVIGIFAIIFLAIGFYMGRSSNKTIDITKIAADKFTNDIYKTIYKDKEKKLEEETQGHDSINEHIVHRPTAEEIEKMNEPQKTREAKEAIAEELRKEKPPEI